MSVDFNVEQKPDPADPNIGELVFTGTFRITNEQDLEHWHIFSRIMGEGMRALNPCGLPGVPVLQELHDELTRFGNS